jgi:hypothetical protein
VSGLAGLLAAEFPKLPFWALRNLIVSGGDPIAALKDVTVSGRRINAFGSMTCQGQKVFGLLRPLPNATGGDDTIAALNINCADPSTQALSVTIKPGGLKLKLADNGKGADLQKGDGIFSVNWTPCAAGSYALNFSNGTSYPVTVSGLTPCISVDPSSGPPGSQATVTGTGFKGGENVVIKFDGKQVASVTADSKGAFTKKITIPNGARSGKRTISAKGNQSKLTVSVAFKVT